MPRSEAWRTPEPVHYDTGGGVLDTADMQASQGLRIIPYGPDAYGVVERMWRGETCSRCTYRYPEAPSPHNYQRILADCGPFAVDETLVIGRIMRGECPHCGYPIGAAIMRHQDEGAPADQQIAKPDEAA